MKKNLPAIDNFCTTLPAYITEMLQSESDRGKITMSEVLQNVLEEHYGIGEWREKLTRDTLKKIETEMAPYGDDLWNAEMQNDRKAFKAFFYVKLPFKADIVLEVDRARYSLLFIIYTTAKQYRKMFRSFYSYYQDGLLNKDMQIEEYARFATIGFKRNFSASHIREIIHDTSFAEKLAEDSMFLKNIILRHKWS
jgi:hypothetical protein